MDEDYIAKLAVAIAKKSPKDEVFAILEKLPNQNSPETIAYFLENFTMNLKANIKVPRKEI